MRRVCVFTGSRADYGPLLAVIRALDEDPDIDLRLLVSGGHLVHEQGLTVHDIQADGFRVTDRVDMVMAGDTPAAVAKSLGLGVIGYADALDRIRPDLLLVLGDRYEALGAVITAALRLLPIAHISGGDLSHGSTDDSLRHSITKLAHVHFTSNEDSRRRVIQMGEDPTHVHATGLPSLDLIRASSALDRVEVESVVGLALHDPVITVTYHPATADPRGSREGVEGLLEALGCFPEATVIFTGTNVDQNGSKVAQCIREYSARNGTRSAVIPSLGQKVYLSLLRHSSLVLGNSSSGLIEAPAMQTPTVNIGSRQDGRVRAVSVVDCGETRTDIESAIRLALSADHRRRSATALSPFGDGSAAPKIVSVLKTVDLSTLLRKKFFDIDR